MLIVATSADIELRREERVVEYRRTMDWLAEHARDHRVVYLETVAESGSFIEERFPVFYSGCHDPSLRNKGAHLGRALARFVREYEHDESLVMQITGRYCFLDRSFLGVVEKYAGYDFYGRKITEISGEHGEIERPSYFTGAFAMAREPLSDWVLTTDWADLDARMENIELDLYEYVQGKALRTLHVPTTRMECNVFGNGRQGAMRVMF